MVLEPPRDKSSHRRGQLIEHLLRRLAACEGREDTSARSRHSRACALAKPRKVLSNFGRSTRGRELHRLEQQLI